MIITDKLRIIQSIKLNRKVEPGRAAAVMVFQTSPNTYRGGPESGIYIQGYSSKI